MIQGRGGRRWVIQFGQPGAGCDVVVPTDVFSLAAAAGLGGDMRVAPLLSQAAVSWTAFVDAMFLCGANRSVVDRSFSFIFRSRALCYKIIFIPKF